MILLRSPSSVPALPAGLHQGAMPAALQHQTVPMAAAANGAVAGTLQNPLQGVATTGPNSALPLVSYAPVNGTFTSTAAALRPTLTLTQSALNPQLTQQLKVILLILRTCKDCFVNVR